jgi:hypothetical protein
MYRSNQFLAKVKATSTDKLFDILPRNDAVAELCSGKFNVPVTAVIQSDNNYHHHHKWTFSISRSQIIKITLTYPILVVTLYDGRSSVGGVFFCC